MIKTYNIELSKKGLPTIWEEGGATTNQGFSYIIADSKGLAKKPIYIRSSGSLSCGKHGLFIVDLDDVIVECKRIRNDYHIWLMYVNNIDIDKRTISCTVLSEFSNGEWSDDEIVQEFSDVISAAEEKSNSYHCREVFYNNDQTKEEL